MGSLDCNSKRNNSSPKMNTEVKGNLRKSSKRKSKSFSVLKEIGNIKVNCANDRMTLEFEPLTKKPKICKEKSEYRKTIRSCHRIQSERVISSNASTTKSVSSIYENEDDHNDPQCVSEYSVDIYFHMRNLELRYKVPEMFLPEKAARYRNILVDWLVDVHYNFKCVPETLFLCVNILDIYLLKMKMSVKKRDLQLIGVTALFIASKYEETCPPSIDDFEWISDMSCSKKQIQKMEKDILHTLNFNVSMPKAINFLRIFCKIRQVTQKVHQLSKFVMELSLVNERDLHVLPSLLAAASLSLSMKLLENIDIDDSLNERMFSVTQVNVSEVRIVMQRISSTFDNFRKCKDTSAVVRKYAQKEQGQVSNIIYGVGKL